LLCDCFVIALAPPFRRFRAMLEMYRVAIHWKK
jgi:hypothetical protein